MSRKANFTAKERNQIKASLIGILEKSPFIIMACKKVGISRPTFYRWKDEDKDFAYDTQRAMDLGREDINEIGECKLMENVQGGNMSAIRFLLENNHPIYKKGKSMKKDTTPYSIDILDQFGNPIEKMLIGATGGSVILPENGRIDKSRTIKMPEEKTKPGPYYKSRAGRIHLKNSS